MTVYDVGAEPPDDSSDVEDDNPENAYDEENAAAAVVAAAAAASDPAAPVEEASVVIALPEGPAPGPPKYRNAENCCYSMQQVLAVLRLSGYDPYVFWQVRARLMYLGSTVTPEEGDELARAVAKTRDNYFHIGDDDDVFFELGRLCYHLGLEDYRLALGLYRASLEVFGAHHVTWYNCALCSQEIGDHREALECLESCLALDPTYPQAIAAQVAFMARAKLDLGGGAEGC